MKKFISLTVLALALLIIPASTVKAEGFVFMGDAYYYVYDDGTIATDTQKGIFYIGPTGRLTIDEVNAQAGLSMSQVSAYTPDTYTIPGYSDDTRAKVASVASGILNRILQPGMSDDQRIRTCFNYMINATEYKRMPGIPSGDWTPSYAYQTLTTGQGNCYQYAAAFAYLLKAAGYETRVGTGQIHSAKGGLTPHGWTEINLGNNWYTIDCEMQDAKKDKYNFYIIPFNQYPIKPLIAEYYWTIVF